MGYDHAGAPVQPAQHGAPAPRIPVLRPRLPPLDALAPYLREIDANRWYSNHGPLLMRFEARLATALGLAPGRALVVGNGTVALALALQALAVRRGGRCLMPSWTYVATPAAACAAGLTPHFVDVDPATWRLDPGCLEARRDLAAVAAVIVVSPFGAPVPLAEWDAFTARTGIPVLVDAAAGFDAVATIPVTRTGSTPIMLSMHATKAFGIGEGGLIVADDAALMDHARRLGNFGFVQPAPGTPPVAAVVGSNAKASEYQAAVGLAALDQWPARRASIGVLTAQCKARLARIDGLHTGPGFGDGWVSSYCNVVLEREVTAVARRLAERGIETRRWWRDGCHADPAYAVFPRDPLPVTEQLARSVLGLPFYPDLTEADVDEVATALEAILRPSVRAPT